MALGDVGGWMITDWTHPERAVWEAAAGCGQVAFSLDFEAQGT